MENKYKEFISYNWNDSEEWRIYLYNITPLPPKEKVNYYRKKFYKLKVDSEFDINYQPEYNKPTRTKEENKDPSIMSSFIAAVEAFLWVTFFFNITFHHNLIKISLISLLLRIIREEGIPLTRQNLKKLFSNDYLHLMIYSCILYLDSISYILLFPITITALYCICDYFKNYLKIFVFCKKYFKSITDKKNEIESLRNFSYILISIYVLITFIIGIQKLSFTMIYLIYFRIIYYLSENLKIVIFRIRLFLEKYKDKKETRPLIKYILNKLF